MPSKSVTALVELVLASFHCGEFAPKTVVMSPVAPVLTFSSSMSAMPTAPKLQPARVYVTHGAGICEPSGCTRLGTVGVPLAETVSVQYWKVLGKLNAPVELVRTKLLLTVWPWRSGYTPVRVERMP